MHLRAGVGAESALGLKHSARVGPRPSRSVSAALACTRRPPRIAFERKGKSTKGESAGQKGWGGGRGPAEILLQVQVRHPVMESHGLNLNRNAGHHHMICHCRPPCSFGRKGLRTALVLTGHHHLRAKPKSFKALIRRRHLRTPPPKPWIFSKCETSLVTDLP